MAKEKPLPEQKDDIPAWFMTYSDVITLLMTFFILLLTFSTTEPERFEKAQTTTFSTGGATGIAGVKMDGPTKDSWVNRIRPPSARIAMRGAEMPPITRSPVKKAFGKGLKSLDKEDDRHNEFTTHFFDVEMGRIFDAEGNLTSGGHQICKSLALQLRDLPFQASVQFTRPSDSSKVVKVLSRLIETEMTRPGQVAMSIANKNTIPDNRMRIVIRRYVGNMQ